MDQDDKDKQSVLDFKCSKNPVQPSEEEGKVNTILDSETALSLVTPEKKILPLKHSIKDTNVIVNDAKGDQLTKIVEIPEK